MKLSYFFAILVIALLFTSTIERRLRRKHKHSRRHHKGDPADNVKQSSIYQFLMGMVKEISSDPAIEKAIDECSAKIEGWATVQAANIDEKEKQIDESNDVKGDFVEGTLTKILDACCSFKDKIIETLSGKFRRYVRLFIQGKVRMSFAKWGFSGLWNSIKETANKVAEAVTSGAKKIGNTINAAVDWTGKKIDEFKDHVKQKLTEVYEPLYEKIKKWYEAKVQKFLDEHPVLKQILEFTVCFIKNNGMMAIPKLFSVFKGVLSQIVHLFSPTGWIKLIVNAICGWRLIRKAFDYIDLAKKEKDDMARAAYRGRALACFLMVAAGENGKDD